MCNSAVGLIASRDRRRWPLYTCGGLDRFKNTYVEILQDSMYQNYSDQFISDGIIKNVATFWTHCPYRVAILCPTRNLIKSTLCLKNVHIVFLNNSVKNKQIWIIFGTKSLRNSTCFEPVHHTWRMLPRTWWNVSFVHLMELVLLPSKWMVLK